MSFKTSYIQCISVDQNTFRLHVNGRNNSQDCCANNVGSCWVRVGNGVRRMQQLPTMLRPTVHRGKDTTHNSLWPMRNERAWPQQCWKGCANGSNIVALRFGDLRNKGNVGSCWLKSLTGFKLCATTTRLRPFARSLTRFKRGANIRGALI